MIDAVFYPTDELGIEQELLGAIEDYPNPTKSEITVKFRSGISNSFLELVDLNGQEVQYNVLSLTSKSAHLGIDHLATGLIAGCENMFKTSTTWYLNIYYFNLIFICAYFYSVIGRIFKIFFQKYPKFGLT